MGSTCHAATASTNVRQMVHVTKYVNIPGSGKVLLFPKNASFELVFSGWHQTSSLFVDKKCNSLPSTLLEKVK